VIINIAATHGGGKSTVVKRVLATADKVVEKHRCTIGHWGQREVTFIGRYGIAGTGGCDTITDGTLYDLISEHATLGHVVFEGVIVMVQHQGVSLLRLHPDVPFHVLLLTTPVEECVRSVDERRARKSLPPGDPKHVKRDVRRAKNYAAALEKFGALVQHVDREEAPKALLKLLGLSRYDVKVPSYLELKPRGVLF
jgi:hypothetical protein